MTKTKEVMLMADVKNLGKSGQIVKVAAGYARNYLLPQGYAAPVTEASKRRLAKLEAQRAEERKARKAAAEKVAATLTGLSVTVKAQTVDGKKLYGSVTATDIIAAIEANRGVKVERSQLNLPDHLKEDGTFDGKITLDEGVVAPFKVEILDDSAEEQA